MMNHIFTHTLSPSPLMSLASTIHITVRQKGRFGDSYLGYIPINPGGFKIDPAPTTRWYKLGAKPGKSSVKLRGDLQVTFQFLSKWSAQTKRRATICYAGRKGMLLQRSSSDLKLGELQHMNSDDLLTGGGSRLNQVKGKKEVLGSLRRSFRRKTKDPPFKKCDDDFATFLTTHSAASTPQSTRKKTTSVVIPDNASNSFSSTGCLSNDSDTGNSISHSPLSGKGLVVSESEEPAVASEQKEKEAVSPEDANVVSHAYESCTYVNMAGWG